jgi:hypothetical protein
VQCSTAVYSAIICSRCAVAQEMFGIHAILLCKEKPWAVSSSTIAGKQARKQANAPDMRSHGTLS